MRSIRHMSWLAGGLVAVFALVGAARQADATVDIFESQAGFGNTISYEVTNNLGDVAGNEVIGWAVEIDDQNFPEIPGFSSAIFFAQAFSSRDGWTGMILDAATWDSGLLSVSDDDLTDDDVATPVNTADLGAYASLFTTQSQVVLFGNQLSLPVAQDGPQSIVGASSGTNPITPGETSSGEFFVQFLDEEEPFLNSDAIAICTGGVVCSTAPSIEVPEPATMSLLGAGLLGLGAIAWRRRRMQG